MGLLLPLDPNCRGGVGAGERGGDNNGEELPVGVREPLGVPFPGLRSPKERGYDGGDELE